MSKTLLSLALCILLPLSCLCPLAPPARAESVQHADLDGDGVEDEILCMADGAGLCLSVNGTGYTVPLNDAPGAYALAIADIDSGDGLQEIVIASEGAGAAYPECTYWQLFRYDGKFLYPLSVDDGTYVDDRIAQPGYAMDGLHAPKLGGDGVLHMPVKGVIWIGALMGAYGYAGHDVRYRLVDGCLLREADDTLYAVHAVEGPEGALLQCTATRALTLFAAMDEGGGTVDVPAGAVLAPVEATPSGWVHMRTADGVDGYLHASGPLSPCTDAAGNSMEGALRVGAVADAPQFTAPAASDGPIIRMSLATPAPDAVAAEGRVLWETAADLDADGGAEQLVFRLVEEDDGRAHVALGVYLPSGALLHQYDMAPFEAWAAYSLRAYLLPAEGGQRVFLESILQDGSACHKQYTLLGYAGGQWTEEITVTDPGQAGGIQLALAAAPGAAETGLFASQASSIPACEAGYRDALTGVFAPYGISFEPRQRAGTDASGALRLAFYFRAVVPAACIGEWWNTGTGNVSRPEGDATAAATSAPQATLIPIAAPTPSVPGTATWGDDTFRPVETPAPTAAAYAGTMYTAQGLVAIDVGDGRWAEYGAAMGGLVRLGGMSASCSSYRASNPYPCDAACAFDGDSTSAWNSNNSRVGQWLRVEWPGGAQRVSGITFINGYAKDSSAWQNNSRAQLVAVFVDGTEYLGTFYLEDHARTQYFPIDGGVECSSLLFRFDATYAGARYDDLCISEIGIYGPGSGTGAGEVQGSGTGTVRATGNVNLRSGPGTGYPDIGTIPNGSIATYLGASTVDGDGMAWHNVRYDGVEGWVSGRWSELVEEGNGAAPTVYGVGGDSYLRSGPGLGYDALGKVLGVGEEATYLYNMSIDGRGVAWYNVRIDGVEGWVSSRYTRLA